MDLPSGAITFLFTDIEGSTRLVKELRERYGEVLQEHQRLLRAAFEAHGGHEVDTQGDSFFVAFSSAREALLAAIEGQLALLSHPWPEGVQIKVRMGLHTGQAVAAGGRYTGLAVHRAARIGAAGHGGQILVSQATQTLLEDEEEDPHVVLRDLGEQRLKDLDRAVRLYQVVADGLPASFPPLRPEAELAQAAEAAIRPPPLWRRPVALVAAALALVGLLAAGVFFGTRDSAGGLSGVRANHVGVIDPQTNEIVAQIAVGIRPGPVAAGGGSVWVGNLQDRTLTRIDARQRSTTATISLENRTPTGIAVGARAVWVAHGLRGQVSRVDAQFNQVTEPIDVAGSSFGSENGAVAVGEGSVWAVFGDSTLARIQPTDGRVVGSALTGAVSAAVVVGGGSVWVANSQDASVYRFNPATFEVGPTQMPSVGHRPTGIAFGEGAVWVANTLDDTVTRIDPSTAAASTIPVGDGPVAVAVGAGAVWVANAAAGTVSRIDPATNEVVRTVELRNAPSGIAIADGAVWVAVQAPAVGAR
ncbi:MAG: adenylate/guanylate cyclase domain-containing protein [Actinomycetota bacterium]